MLGSVSKQSCLSPFDRYDRILDCWFSHIQQHFCCWSQHVNVLKHVFSPNFGCHPNEFSLQPSGPVMKKNWWNLPCFIVKNHPCGVFRFVMGVPKCFIHLKIIHYKDHLAIALPPWLRKPPLLGLGSRTQPLRVRPVCCLGSFNWTIFVLRILSFFPTVMALLPAING